MFARMLHFAPAVLVSGVCLQIAVLEFGTIWTPAVLDASANCMGLLKAASVAFDVVVTE